MSGVCGVVALDGRPVEEDAVRAMAGAAGFRGRDGIHVRCEGPVGMAYLALHVTAEDADDRQPSVSDGLWLVADARIDNGDELLRAISGGAGARPRTTTSLLLAAYGRWGMECVEYLVGDYAFVVWDARLGRVFAARSRSGIRTIHYRTEPGRFLFGTDVTQVLAGPSVPVELDERAVAGHLAGGYARADWTFYDGVAELPPGHALQRTPSGRVRVRSFWDPDHGRSVRYRRESEYAEHFRELLEEAVRCRIRTERQVGVLLSGGVDSGAVTSMAGHLIGRDSSLTPGLRTYSFAFSELEGCDERYLSDQIVAEYDLAARPVPGDDAWPLSGYPSHGPDRNSPFAWVYGRLLGRCVSHAAEDGTSVVLTGEGGDELLGDGVFDLAGLATSFRLGHLTREVRSLAAERGTSAARVARREVLGPMRGAVRELPWLSRLAARRSTTPPVAKRPWVSEDLARRTGIEELIRADPRQRWSAMSPRERRSMRLSAPHLPRQLSWQERLHARAGVGAAMPLADQRLVRYVLSIPPWVVNAPSEPKRLARRALAGIMPDGARHGARKIVPTSLYDRGMRDRGLDVLRDLMSGHELVRRGFANRAALQEQLEVHLSGRTPSYDLWWPVTLEWWLRSYWSDE